MFKIKGEDRCSPYFLNKFFTVYLFIPWFFSTEYEVAYNDST